MQSLFLCLQGPRAGKSLYSLQDFRETELIFALWPFRTQTSQPPVLLECLWGVLSHPTLDQPMSPCRTPGVIGLSHRGWGREGDTEEILICSPVLVGPQGHRLLRRLLVRVCRTTTGPQSLSGCSGYSVGTPEMGFWGARGRWCCFSPIPTSPWDRGWMGLMRQLCPLQINWDSTCGGWRHWIKP